MIKLDYSEDEKITSNTSSFFYVCNYMCYYPAYSEKPPKKQKNNKFAASQKRRKIKAKS